MHRRPLALAITAVVGFGTGAAALVFAAPRVSVPAMPSGAPAPGTPANVIPASVHSVEFIGMAAPDTVEKRAKAYTEAKVKVIYANGAVQEFPLAFHQLHDTTSTFDGVTVGDLYDRYGDVLKDSNGKPQRSETPDANSLIEIPGAQSGDPMKRRLFLVTHHEYDWLDTAGVDQYGKQPMTMSLATIDQDRITGELTTVAVKNIDMSAVKGLWIPCAGSLSPWNTHLGSEEYEPDGRCAEAPDARCPSNPSYTSFNDPKNFLNLDSMNRYLDPAGFTKPARVYDYGLVPEITVDRNGNASVVKHRTLGRISREIVEVMPDDRTAYQGDDGTYNVLTMFVADRPGDLSAGTLYAAKWNQTSPTNQYGGEATLTWYRLGHATNLQIEAMVAGGITFSDIFEVKTSYADRTECEDDGYRLIKAGHNLGLVECLKVKNEQAAAFLETRRYAAYVGATTEFEKFEGVTVNEADGKVYIAMTRMRDGMETRPKDPADHIETPVLLAGGVYEIDLKENQRDANGNAIDSKFVGTQMRPLVLGKDIRDASGKIQKDEVGNTAEVDRIANPDNIKYSEKMRTLFIGEDSSTAHINNFLWAYNVDTGKLSRIFSLPAGAESTGLQVLDDLNGHAYLMSNYQHPGDFSVNIDPALKAELEPMIDKYKAGIGYLGGLPGLK